jgi:hypothetical protein
MDEDDIKFKSCKGICEQQMLCSGDWELGGFIAKMFGINLLLKGF